MHAQSIECYAIGDLSEVSLRIVRLWRQEAVKAFLSVQKNKLKIFFDELVAWLAIIACLIT